MFEIPVFLPLFSHTQIEATNFSVFYRTYYWTTFDDTTNGALKIEVSLRRFTNIFFQKGEMWAKKKTNNNPPTKKNTCISLVKGRNLNYIAHNKISALPLKCYTHALQDTFTWQVKSFYVE